MQVKDMKEERQGLLKDLAKLKAALQQLALRHQGQLSTLPSNDSKVHVHVSVLALVSRLQPALAKLEQGMRHQQNPSRCLTPADIGTLQKGDLTCHKCTFLSA